LTDKLDFNGEWGLVAKLPKDDKKRLAFYDKLFVEAYLRKIKLELIVLNPEFLIASKRQIVTYDQKLEG
jgi:hypothetical protein